MENSPHDSFGVKSEDELNLSVPDDVLDLCSPFIPCEVMMKSHWMEGGNRLESSVQEPSSSEHPCSSIEAMTNNAELMAVKGNPVQPLACNACTYLANGCDDLRAHILKSHDKAEEKELDIYRCRLCDFQTTMKRNLLRHERNHSEQKRYVCDQCDYQNNSRVLLIKHKRNHVVNFKNSKHKCPVCEFGSDCKDDWKRHVVVHDKVKLHECSLCTYATTKLSDIKRHRGMHAKNDPSYQNSRQFHGYSFKETVAPVTNIDPPMQQVSQEQIFMCSYCKFTTHYKSLLSSHLLSHEESKFLSCTECNYKTTYMFRLKNHMQTHLPDKPYKCSQCNFETKHKVSLPRHVLNCHKDISIIKYSEILSKDDVSQI